MPGTFAYFCPVRGHKSCVPVLQSSSGASMTFVSPQHQYSIWLFQVGKLVSEQTETLVVSLEEMPIGGRSALADEKAQTTEAEGMMGTAAEEMTTGGMTGVTDLLQGTMVEAEGMTGMTGDEENHVVAKVLKNWMQRWIHTNSR